MSTIIYNFDDLNGHEHTPFSTAVSEHQLQKVQGQAQH